MRVLVHICCGPCAITVLQALLEQGCDVCGFFYNPNIHPLSEYMRRRRGASQVCQKLQVPLVYADTLPWEEQELELGNACFPGADRAPFPLWSSPAPGQNLPELPPAAAPYAWLRSVAGRERGRCFFCWTSRLAKTARYAATAGFDGYTTTLLYSRYQNHAYIKDQGESCAQLYGIFFCYADFRSGWQQGVRLSKEWSIYRQGYCGCIFSEYDRYAQDLSKELHPPVF